MVTPVRAQNEEVDELTIKWDCPHGNCMPVVEGATSPLHPIVNLLSAPWWTEFIHFSYSGVAEHSGRVNNDEGFAYPDNDDPDEESPGMILVMTHMGEIYIESETFERLMSRYFQVVIDGATQSNHPAIKEFWWDDFVRSANTIKERLEPSQPK